VKTVKQIRPVDTVELESKNEVVIQITNAGAAEFILLAGLHLLSITLKSESNEKISSSSCLPA